MADAKAYAVQSATSPVAPFRISRREPGASDVRIKITHCGICHTDIHQAHNEFGMSTYPMVPGHEIVGAITHVGADVKQFKVGDLAGVGCMVDSCRKCAMCKSGLEQHCEVLTSFTYNSTEQDRATPTQGGYSDHIVVPEAFALRIASDLPLERVAPLLCAGITTYSPLKRWNVGKGSKLGVMGLGGLGHVAVKIGVALGAEVAVLSGSKSKQADAKRLGAHDFVLTAEAGSSLTGRYDLIIDTVSADHDVNAVLSWVKARGTLVLVGAAPKPLSIGVLSLLGGSKSLVGSSIGGVGETQDMLDFCADHDVLADVETIAMKDVNTAYERLTKNDVRYRFTIDMSTL